MTDFDDSDRSPVRMSERVSSTALRAEIRAVAVAEPFDSIVVWSDALTTNLSKKAKSRNEIITSS